MLSTARLAALMLLVGVSALTSTPSSAAAAAPRNGVNCRPLSTHLEMVTELCVCTPCHLCEFSLAEGKCTLIVSDDMDLADGSDVSIDQPKLDPAHWFLTADEITSSRGGVPRDDLSVFTTKNSVTGFVASNEYFHAVYDDLEKAGAGHRIFLTGWSVDEVPFKPDAAHGTGVEQPTSFTKVFGDAIARGADFHALVWSNLLETAQNVKMRDLLHSLPFVKHKSGRAHFVFDDRLAAATNAHHQKSVVIERDDGELVAFVGGVDLTSDRWDTVTHDAHELRTATGIKRLYNGWVDAHVRIVGPATRDVAANFLGRWNSKTLPSTDLLDDYMDFENPAHVALPPGTCGIDPEATVVTGEHSSVHTQGVGSHAVQIARTFSCAYKHYEFAPKGETSIFQARIKAIRNAQNYIYIEDQYFVLVPQLLTELMKVLPRLQRIIVIVPRPDASATLGGYEKFMFDNVEPLQKKFPNKFQFYTTKKSRNVYVHSKLVIIDDVYLSIGSANWNRRSMTSDSEISANIVDDEVVDTPDGIQVAKLARDFRIRKFMEKTSRSYEELDAMPFLDAANLLDVAAAEEETLIEPMELDERFYFAAYNSELVHEFSDADDLCVDTL